MANNILRFFIIWMSLCATASASDSLPDRVERWMDSVVLLVIGPGWCSGVVIDEEGTVATAYHCVASGLRSEVHTQDGMRHMGKTIAARPKDDIALISVPGLAGTVAPLTIRDSTPRRGETVYGLGHPFAPYADRSRAMEGMLTWSVTRGIVSNVGPRLLQTDAALNPGNSGGPVVDEEGRIVGITSRKLTGDNIAFLSTAKNLQGLVDSRKKPSLVGGVVGMSLSLVLPQDTAASGVGLGLGTTIRDRIVLNGELFLSGVSESHAVRYGDVWTPAWALTGGLKQTLGRGHFHSAVEVGGGLVGSQTFQRGPYLESERRWSTAVDRDSDPALYARFTFGGAGIRMVALPWRAQAVGGPSYMIALDFGLPVLATY